MGKRFGILRKRKREKETEATIDLGYEKTYQIETPEGCGIGIGKLHGIGRRNQQQDAFGTSELKEEVIESKGVLAILADGMGGLSDGEKASMATVISCLNYFETHNMDEETPACFVEMAKNANMEVKEVLGSASGSSGSTLAAALVKERKIFWVSVGDSRVFLWRDGELTQISQDHNYAAQLREMVEAGDVDEEDANSDPQRNALTSYIGISSLEQIDYNEEAIEAESGDRILLLSDGVYNSVTEEELADSMQLPLSRAMMRVGMQVEEKRKKNQDNYTAIVLEIK